MLLKPFDDFNYLEGVAKQAIYGYSLLQQSIGPRDNHGVAFKIIPHGAGRIDVELVGDLTTRYPDKAFRSMFRLAQVLIALHHLGGSS
jgi:hypothetical protein